MIGNLVRHFGAALLLALLLVPPARATLSCPAPHAAIEVTATLAPPRIDNKLPQPALQRRAGHRHFGRALGLYEAEIAARWNLVIGRLEGAGEACRWIAKVEVRISAPSRVIYVLRERRPGTCAYASVLGHERQHQATDDAVVEEYRLRIRDAAAAAVAALPTGAVAAGEAAAAEKRIAGAVSAAVEREFIALKREREARQKALDTREEYRRVGAACG